MAIASTTTTSGVQITGTGDAELLVGGTGNDLLISNGGADTIDGGAGSDTAAFLASEAGYSWSGSASDFVLHPILGGGDKEVANVEFVQFKDVTVSTDSLFAAAPAPAPAPAPTVNTITGTGADELLTGTSGNDLIISNGGADTIDGGAGTDTAAFLANKAGYSWSGSATDFTLHPILGGGDKHVTNVEFVQFRDVTVSTDSLLPSTVSGGGTGPTNPIGDASSGLITSVPAGAHIIHMGANQAYHTLSAALA